MPSQDYDNPKVEARWLEEQRTTAQHYLDKEEVRLVQVMDGPIWFVAPYVALWKTSRLDFKQREEVWVISGDLPTDYLESPTTLSPREAMLAFAKRWETITEDMLKGRFPEEFQIGRHEDQKDLGALLKSRAKVLSDWAADEQLWQ